MRAGDLRAALVAPLAGYVFVRLLDAGVPWSGGVVLGLAASFATLLAVGARRSVLWPFVPWGVAVAAAAVWTAGLLPLSLDAAALETGLLIGSPWVAFAWLALWRESLPATVANLPLCLTTSAFGLGLARALTGPAAATAAGWVGTFGRAVALQAGVLGLSVHAGLPSAPAGYLGDVTFDVLGLLAFLGLLLTLLLTSERLPQRATRPARGAELPTVALAWTEATSTFAARTVPPSAYQVAGVVSLLAALAAVLLFAGAATVNGFPFLEALAVAALLLLVGLGYLGYPSTWESWRAPRPAIRSVRPAHRPATGDEGEPRAVVEG